MWLATMLKRTVMKMRTSESSTFSKVESILLLMKFSPFPFLQRNDDCSCRHLRMSHLRFNSLWRWLCNWRYSLTRSWKLQYPCETLYLITNVDRWNFETKYAIWLYLCSEERYFTNFWINNNNNNKHNNNNNNNWLDGPVWVLAYIILI
jgi:hypothetical protein